MGMTRCSVDPCLYIKKSDEDFIVLCVHSDDGNLISTKKESIEEFMTASMESVRKAKILLESFKVFEHLW